MGEPQREPISTYIWAFLFVVLAIGLVIGVGYVIYDKVDWDQFLPQPTPDPNSAHDPLAIRIERMLGKKVDVTDVIYSGDFNVTLAMVVLGEISEADSLLLDTFLAEDYAVVRIIRVLEVPQLDNMVYVVGGAFSCARNTDQATKIQLPLKCIPDPTTVRGIIVPDEGLKYLGFQ